MSSKKLNEFELLINKYFITLLLINININISYNNYLYILN